MFRARLVRHGVLISAVSSVAALLGAFAGSGDAAQLVNIANNAPVIGGSGDYDGNYNTGTATYQASHVTNGQNATPNNNIGSTITEPGQDGSYWLGKDGQSTGYFVVDLGTAQNIGGFEIFNTRNGPYDDRGTGNFQILGSNTITNLGPALGDTLVSPVVLATGTLTNQTYVGAFGNEGNTPLVPNEVNSTDTAAFRYIEFQALSIGASADKGYGAAGVGLNELRIFSSPEPGSLVLLGLGALGVGLVARGRRRVAVASTLGLVAMLASVSAGNAHAGQLINIANGAPVVGGTGDYNNGAYNTPSSFGSSNVTNGQNASPNNNFGSPITEPTSGDGSFWLGQQGQSTGYFVLDLGSRPDIGGFEIFNTRNGQYDDRGTGNFAIYGSNTVTTGPLGDVLVSPTLLAQGVLTPQTYPGTSPGNTPLVPDEFTSLNHGGFRYIEFQALGYGASLDKMGITSPAGVGLNELRIFSSPEPGSLVLMGLGIVGVGLVVRRRRGA